MMARLATRVAATTESSLPYLPKGKTVVSGYPVRPDFFAGSEGGGTAPAWASTQKRRRCWSAAAVWARTRINQIVADNLPALLDLCQLVHLSGAGRLRWAEASQRRVAGSGASKVSPVTRTCRKCRGRWPPRTSRSCAPAQARSASCRWPACRRFSFPAPSPTRQRTRRIWPNRGAAIVLPEIASRRGRPARQDAAERRGTTEGDVGGDALARAAGRRRPNR